MHHVSTCLVHARPLCSGNIAPDIELSLIVFVISPTQTVLASCLRANRISDGKGGWGKGFAGVSWDSSPANGSLPRAHLLHGFQGFAPAS
jgi:hypothetical protein